MKVFSFKKGQVDVMSVLISVFVIAVVIFVVGYSLKSISDNWSTGEPASDDFVSSFSSKYYSVMDNAFVFILFGLMIASLILAYFVDSHPIFYFLSFFFLFIVGLISMVVANFFDDFVNTNGIDTVAALMPKITFTMTKLPFIIIAYTVLLGVILYNKISY